MLAFIHICSAFTFFIFLFYFSPLIGNLCADHVFIIHCQRQYLVHPFPWPVEINIPVLFLFTCSCMRIDIIVMESSLPSFPARQLWFFHCVYFPLIFNSESFKLLSVHTWEGIEQKWNFARELFCCRWPFCGNKHCCVSPNFPFAPPKNPPELDCTRVSHISKKWEEDFFTFFKSEKASFSEFKKQTILLFQSLLLWQQNPHSKVSDWNWATVSLFPSRGVLINLYLQSKQLNSSWNNKKFY